MVVSPDSRTQTRDRQILTAAAELFYVHGFHGVGVVEIGARIGISGPAIYRHFTSKDEILARLFHEAMDGLTEPRDGHADPRAASSPKAELEHLVRRHVDFALGSREMLSIFTHEERHLPAPLRKRFRRRMRQHAQSWEEVLRRCYPDADERAVPAAVQGAIGLIHSVAFWPQSAMRAPELADLLAGQVLDGLGSLGAQPGSASR